VSSNWSGYDSFFFVIIPFVYPIISPPYSFHPLRPQGKKSDFSSTWALFSYFKIVIWCPFYSKLKLSWEKIKIKKEDQICFQDFKCASPSVSKLLSQSGHLQPCKRTGADLSV
jgi:hypothetical protein